MKIVTDSASLYSPAEGKDLGIQVVPTCAIIDGQVYRDFEDINCQQLLEKIAEGGRFMITTRWIDAIEFTEDPNAM